MFNIGKYKINKKNIFFGDVIRYTNDFDGPIEDIVVKGSKGMYVTDLEHTLLIQNGDEFINLTCIMNKKAYSKLKKESEHIGTLYKCYGSFVSEIEKMLDKDIDEKNQFLVKKDTLVPYDEAIAEYYGVLAGDRDYLIFNECKRISERCTKEHDGMDYIVEQYMNQNHKTR